MKATDIRWDIDDPEVLGYLPTELDIPDGIGDIEAISDYISDFSGFCHLGFCLSAS
ncbi:hypothetical protein [uncultured Flavonifractor sp.]|uniref:hypothetical protein n=1 Tax=uncultured Flavonifractor sp. TaxID=1193534 RepID=UPI00259A9E76|nr:hypothetical protein [uncultured Flavonifractor sp.]